MADIALVTGASGGIGEEFARLLASEGCDLVLAARSGDKLSRLAESLAAAHRIRAHALPIDLSTASSAAQVRAFLESKSLSVDILVNNAGFATFGPFAESDLDTELAQIQLNITTLTQLTRLPAAADDPAREGEDPERRVDGRVPARADDGRLLRDEGLRAFVLRGAGERAAGNGRHRRPASVPGRRRRASTSGRSSAPAGC
jgi:NAD(P)-dependent dehydrogenase (short-subunit alcohol dehydrogenase family)